MTNPERERFEREYQDEGERMKGGAGSRDKLPSGAREEEQSGQGTRDYGRAAGDPGLPGQEPGDADGGMGGHMGAGEYGNDFGRYGGTRTAPEDTRQNPDAASRGAGQSDPELGRTDEGPRDEYGRPIANGSVDSGRQGGRSNQSSEGGQKTPRGRQGAQRAGQGGQTQATGSTGDPNAAFDVEEGETRPAGGYAQDQRAADDTLGGYGGVAGGVDARPQQQRGLTEGKPAAPGEAEGKPAKQG
jgi:hypothetical protein